MKQIKITKHGKTESRENPGLRWPTYNTLLMDGYLLTYPTVIIKGADRFELLEHNILDRLLVYGAINMHEQSTMRIYY